MSERERISREQLDDCFSLISTQKKIALAVSGGSDSLALLLLVDRWRRARLQRKLGSPDLLVLSVNHGLRIEAAEECRFVMEQAKMLGYAGEVLTWSGTLPSSRIQEKAREIRYQLLAAACHMHEIKYLLTAHHLDDQAETFLMRLARGSGVDGLCAMAKESRRYGLRLLRPLLTVEKKLLLQEVQEAGWSYVTDPSNRNRRFERVRLREHKAALEEMGLAARMIALSTRRLRRARRALDEICEGFLAENALFSDYGTVRIDQLAFCDAPDEIALRALARCLRICGGSREMPNMARLEKLVARMKKDFDSNHTLAGCRIIAKGDFWLIVREVGRIKEQQKRLEPGGCIFWDGRYIVCADKKASSDMEAGPLLLEKGQDNDQLAAEKVQRALQAIPREALPSLLALRHKKRLVAVPAIDFWTPEAVSAGLQVKFMSNDETVAPFEEGEPH